jgi:hypothetical protein
MLVKTGGPNQPDVAAVFGNLSRALEALGRKSDIKETLARISKQ